MSKHIKMMLYGEPGVGKSVFASKAPRPFFITTDGNYEWLTDFGAKIEDHKQVYSWDEAKKVFAEDFDNYDTIVVDLVEDLFKWCEQEFCARAKLEHISDVGYGKGYDITRNEFFLEISKLLSKPKNVILLSHGITFVTKDRRGVEHTRYAPSNRIPDKVLDMIEGRLRYCLRCYAKAEETGDGNLIKRRYLSLVPKENEFGIIRGVDEYKTQHDIPLDWNEFTKAINYDNTVSNNVDNNVVVKEEAKVEDKAEIKEEPKETTIAEQVKEEKNEEKKETLIEQTVETKTEVKEETKTEATEPAVPSKPVETQQISKQDRLAAIRARMAQINARQGE